MSLVTTGGSCRLERATLPALRRDLLRQALLILPRACSKKTPFARNALQYVLTAILELESGTCDQILHCLRDEDLGGARYGPHAGPDAHGDAPNLAPDRLDLTSVETGPDPEPWGRTAFTIAWAHCTPRAGPSKEAKNPSPAVSISLPR